MPILLHPWGEIVVGIVALRAICLLNGGSSSSSSSSSSKMEKMKVFA